MPPWNPNISAGLTVGTTCGAPLSRIYVTGTLAGFTVATGLTANTSRPLQFLAATLAPTTTMGALSRWHYAMLAQLNPALAVAVDLLPQKSLQAGFTVASQLTIPPFLQPFLLSVIRPTPLSIATGIVPTLGQVSHIYYPNFATLAAAANVMAWGGIPYRISAALSGGSGVTVNEIKGQIIPPQSAVFDIEAGITTAADVLEYQWDQYGSQLLYAAASGLEKAMIDTDAPRQVGIYAEIIIDTWDPYKCPYPLLPYLAWAMGVTFWNDGWSEQTKRDWIALQWQFKAWRGTNAGIDMVVDFAGRDVSPFGYHVRDIITQPQGQYPSPGQTKEQREEWLATLPQVRVYLFKQSGQAYTDEFYINYSYLSP